MLFFFRNSCRLGRIEFGTSKHEGKRNRERIGWNNQSRRQYQVHGIDLLVDMEVLFDSCHATRSFMYAKVAAIGEIRIILEAHDVE